MVGLNGIDPFCIVLAAQALCSSGTSAAFLLRYVAAAWERTLMVPTVSLPVIVSIYLEYHPRVLGLTGVGSDWSVVSAQRFAVLASGGHFVEVRYCTINAYVSRTNCRGAQLY